MAADCLSLDSRWRLPSTPIEGGHDIFGEMASLDAELDSRWSLPLTPIEGGHDCGKEHA